MTDKPHADSMSEAQIEASRTRPAGQCWYWVHQLHRECLESATFVLKLPTGKPMLLCGEHRERLLG